MHPAYIYIYIYTLHLISPTNRVVRFFFFVVSSILILYERGALSMAREPCRDFVYDFFNIVTIIFL